MTFLFHFHFEPNWFVFFGQIVLIMQKFSTLTIQRRDNDTRIYFMYM